MSTVTRHLQRLIVSAERADGRFDLGDAFTTARDAGAAIDGDVVLIRVDYLDADGVPCHWSESTVTAWEFAAPLAITCDMREGCQEPITHIGSKGYVYCSSHVTLRAGMESTRKLRADELRQLIAGKPLASFEEVGK